MNPIIQILGPTGVGKSRVALAVAREFNAEIISADSVQVYSGFDIGTDKISPQSRREIPHHLIDIIEDCSQFNASKFLDLSFAAAQGILARGKIPLVCGGTALYLRVMIRGIFPESKNQAQRQQLKSEAASIGWDALRRQLEKIDPLYAKKIGPNDKVRLVRALEIYRNSGLPPSEAFRLSRSPFAAHCFIRIGLQVDRDILYQNISHRVDRMLANGLVDEVKKLLASHPPSCPPFRSLGYKEILSHLRGETDLATARELIQCHSRQFAKRQLSWFRQEKDIEWFAAEDTAAIMEFIKKCLSKKP
ncbi:MAG: tRNA (adenosine(37)-N6)-dimethylallyltransferase MiaA [Acidobacteria bacterium]|nr:tRNA (adenosine(37)-N6)-dimethylallyltransferase MiaA [Acidobacteriota bacterium]MBU4306506.1 tRNA (adenosine(37)-N6)-dimethylallyltransferase MiaA [Acidobacteriota bacterium]MCG2812762.1 tRNA (adenosine(37)-N6)-dimethylallyltransferase MiaA [Candidatus Aminicenantes bacterium]